jgi:predicted DNA-binding transcriptional regulator YafY
MVPLDIRQGMSYIGSQDALMKASRLLSILMLLQSHGRMTAGALAQTMEVSERPILRDIDQACRCGVSAGAMVAINFGRAGAPSSPA